MEIHINILKILKEIIKEKELPINMDDLKIDQNNGQYYVALEKNRYYKMFELYPDNIASIDRDTAFYSVTYKEGIDFSIFLKIIK